MKILVGIVAAIISIIILSYILGIMKAEKAYREYHRLLSSGLECQDQRNGVLVVTIEIHKSCTWDIDHCMKLENWSSEPYIGRVECVRP